MSLQKRKPLDWDELRLVLAIGRAGSLSGGARALGIDHSTGFRRLGALETRLGVRLFERARDGYAPTPAGEAAIAAATGLDETVTALERRLAGADLRPAGTVRVTTTDTLLDVLAPVAAAFRSAQPEITLELVADDAFYTLTRRDADVALRPTAAPPDGLVGRRLAAVASAVYAAAGRAPRRRDAAALAAADWIGFDDRLAHLGAARWLAATVPDARIACRAGSLPAAAAAARAGLGLAVLPCCLADPDPALVRVGTPLPEAESSLWLLTHPDLRRVARIRAFLDFAGAALTRARPLLEGRVPLGRAPLRRAGSSRRS